MMCTVCGKEVQSGARFCSHCGAYVVPETLYGYSGPRSRFVRPQEGRMIAGVCAGIARYYAIDVAIVRLVVALCILFAGLPIVAYLIAWLVMPNEEFVPMAPPQNSAGAQ
ncbi:PspC domain-containing protein [Granulicella cerasi]|uniref:PspC domain-containing protein n=1 Tax=Granulicella cerasi TaxID=741063 RepID=A0ABW1Z685_9BACT|nr:PspC domain-containing protein [Granulicella cerasi]